MENNQEIKHPIQEMKGKDQEKVTKGLVWDCGSSLYDSFELKSFERQLDSALLQSRTLSMPHLVDRRVVAPPPPTTSLPPQAQPQAPSKKSSSSSPSKISRSLNKFIKSVFKKYSGLRVQERPFDHVAYDKSGALTTIPEAPEIDFGGGGLSPEMSSFVRRTASDRFAPATMGISCA